jgi:hypothetical protein
MSGKSKTGDVTAAGRERIHTTLWQRVTHGITMIVLSDT